MKFKYVIFKNSNTGHFIDIEKLEDGYRVREYFFSSILGGQQTLEEVLFKTKKAALDYKKNRGFRLEGIQEELKWIYLLWNNLTK